MEIIWTKGVSAKSLSGHIWSPAVELRDSDNESDLHAVDVMKAYPVKVSA